MLGAGPLKRRFGSSTRSFERVGRDRVGPCIVRMAGRLFDGFGQIGFVVATRAEAFGIAFVEAMASGVPAVVAATGGLPEIINSPATAASVKPENATTPSWKCSLSRTVDVRWPRKHRKAWVSGSTAS